MNDTLQNRLTYLILFLLPLQTRWIFGQELLDGEAWEYGALSLYGLEILLLIAIAFRRRVAFLNKARSPVHLALWLLAALVISFVFSLNRAVSAVALMHAAFAVVLFILLLDRRLSTKKCAIAFLLGLIPVCALGWYQVLSGTSPVSSWFGLSEHLVATPGASVVETASERVLRAYGTFQHPNIFGGYLALGLLLILWLGRESKRTTFVWQALLAIVFSVTLVVTFSRSAWLALAVAVVTLIVGSFFVRATSSPLSKGGMEGGHASLACLIAVMLVSAATTVFVFSDAVFTRFDPSARLEAKSIEERTSQYDDLDDVAMKNPLTGVGPGAYTLALSEVRPGQEIWSYQPIHNAFALIFAEAGLLGFLAFVFWFTSIDRVNYAVAKTTNGTLALGLGTALLVLGLLDHYLWSLPSGLWLAAFSFAMILRWSEEAK